MYFFRWICQFNLRSTAVSEVYCQTGGIPGGQTDGNETKTIPDRELERVGKRRNVEDLLAVVSGLQAVGGRGSRCVLNGSQGGDSRRQISILQVKRVVAVRTAGRQAERLVPRYQCVSQTLEQEFKQCKSTYCKRFVGPFQYRAYVDLG